jgi:membrane associated rhomboid family serine protease
MFPIRDTIPNRRRPVVTFAIIAACVAAFIVELALEPRQLDAFMSIFGLVPARYSNPRWAEWAGLPASYWPFLTYMFLHGGWMHLLGNMWFLWLFGDNVEDRLGRPRFLFFYLACGLVAALAQFALYPGSHAPLVGASGAISGVMGAYFLLYPGARIMTLIPVFIFIQLIEVPAFVFLGVWFLLQFFSGTAEMAGSAGNAGGVAFWAHVGGFVAGMLLLRFFIPRRLPWRTAT